MKILFVVDLQREFADQDGHYGNILQFVRSAIENNDYDKVIATKCKNKPDSNFVRYSHWSELMDGTAELEFEPDEIIEKISYGLTDYSFLPDDAEIHVMGYNTGACVLKVALDLFDLNKNFKILLDYCYSSNGQFNHEKGVWTLKNLMEYAVE